MNLRLAIATLLLSSFLAGADAGADAGLPRGWYTSGAGLASYEVVSLENGACGKRAVRVASKPGQPGGPIGVLQAFRADEYRGQRVRYTATLEAAGVEGWTGLFFRADTSTRETVAFDDMQARPVRGSVHCARVSVVADVPPEAEMLALGLGLHGAGTVELSDVTFERVSGQVAITSGVRQTNGRVNAVWFTDSLLTVFQSKVGGKLSRRSPGEWRDEARDIEARVEGERVLARLFKADTGSSAVMLTGEFTIDHEGDVTTIEGNWGTAVARYPVLITLSPKQLDMKWGFYERHLKQEPSAQLASDCRFYGEKASLTEYRDKVELCGAVLSATPPPVQTVMAFLVTGFRRGE